MSRQTPASRIPKLAIPVQKKTRTQTASSPVGSPTHQKGSFIQVIARVRPRLQCELFEKDAVEVLTDGKTMLLGDGSNRKQYVLDKVFDSRGEEGHQIKVFYEFAKNLVIESLKGYNVCIFAYGHTGSGKTYTMLGDGGFAPNVIGSEAGILPRFLHSVFESHASENTLASKSSSGWGYTCEFYEVYNEHINDLIAAQKMEQRTPRKNTSSREGLRVHVHPKHGVRIENLTCSVVASAEEALGLVNFGNQMRTVAATTMNERSSRSHAIFTFRFEPLDAPHGKNADGPQCQSTVTFVDLAGKEEKLASNKRATQFREMCYINTSLFHLAHLITKLSDGNVDRGSLSDFRNSKLTLLLSHALMGNSRTALVATLAPPKSYFEDTVSTMNFAQSVKKIKTRPTVNNKTQKTVISELEAEVKMLQRELNTTKTNNFDKEQELLTAQALINHYKTSWEEAVARSEVAKSDRQSVILKAHLLDPTSWSQALPMSPNGRLAPFLTKLCDDPSLQGCCNFFLGKGDLIIGRNSSVCDIVLRGVGVTEEMCTIKCNDDGSVKVEICNDEDDIVPRVLVRGTALSPTDNPEVTMQHSDCIIFGYAHAFRLVAPTPEQLRDNRCMDARDLVRSTIGDLDMVSALEEIVDETGTEFKSIYPYIQNLSTKLPEAHLQTLLQSLHCMCPLIDEANVITSEVWRNETIRFEMRALTNIFDIENHIPTLVVCVLTLSGEGGMAPIRRTHSFAMSLDQTMPMSPSSNRKRHNRMSMTHAIGLSQNMSMLGGCDMLTYVWSMEKFLWRLGEIRDIYQEGSQAGDNFKAVRQRLASKPNLNPWREVSTEDVKLLEESGCERRDSVEESATSSLAPIDSSPSTERGTASAERKSSVASASSVDIQQVASLLETEAFSSRAHEPAKIPVLGQGTVLSSCIESAEQILEQEQSPEELSLKRAAAWLEKSCSESPRGSMHSCPSLQLPSFLKRRVDENGSVSGDDEVCNNQTESDMSCRRGEEDQFWPAQALSGDDPHVCRRLADEDLRLQTSGKDSWDSPSKWVRSSSFSESGADSPRVLASVNAMQFKIDSFCKELEKRDTLVAQLTEERDRTAAAFEALLQRIGEHVGHSAGASTMLSRTSGNTTESAQSVPTETNNTNEQHLSCKKEDLDEMANLLENLRKQVDRLNINTQSVTWQPPLLPMMHSPVPSSPRGFAWQSPGATPVSTLAARVISTVPLDMGTGQASRSIDLPASPMEIARATAPGSPSRVRTSSRPHSPAQSPLLSRTCSPSQSVSPPPLNFVGLSPAGVQRVTQSVDNSTSPLRSPRQTRPVPTRTVVSPPNRQFECFSQAHARSAPSSPRGTVATPGRSLGSVKVSPSKILKRGSPGPSRRGGSLTLKHGAGSPNSKVPLGGASTAPHPSTASWLSCRSAEGWAAANSPRHAPRPSSSSHASPQASNLTASPRPLSSIGGIQTRAPLLTSNCSQGVSIVRPAHSVQAPLFKAGGQRQSPNHELALPTRGGLVCPQRRSIQERVTSKR